MFDTLFFGIIYKVASTKVFHFCFINCSISQYYSMEGYTKHESMNSWSSNAKLAGVLTLLRRTIAANSSIRFCYKTLTNIDLSSIIYCYGNYSLQLSWEMSMCSSLQDLACGCVSRENNALKVRPFRTLSEI